MQDGYVLEDTKHFISPMLVDDGFNDQIIASIDATLLDLMQIGCINAMTDSIEADTTWLDIITPPPKNIDNPEPVYAAIRSYVGAQAKMLFAPPASNAMTVLENLSSKLIFRIREAYDETY